MRRRGLRPPIVALACSLALAGCSTGSGGGGTGGTSHAAAAKATANQGECGKNARTIKHDLGSTTITGTPKRVVALEFSFVDALASVGVSPVGVADDNDSKRLVPQIRAKIGTYKSVGLRASPNLQVIASLKPDLIIADTKRDKTIESQLTAIAPTISLSSLSATYDQTLDSTMVIAQALNDCAQMSRRLGDHSATMKALAAKAASAAGTKALFAVAFDKGVTAHYANDYTAGVLQALGLGYAAPAQGQLNQGPMSLESFATTNPDIVFVADATPTTLLSQWRSNPLYQHVNAVSKHKLFTVDDNLWSRSRGITSSELIAQQAISDLQGG